MRIEWLRGGGAGGGIETYRLLRAAALAVQQRLERFGRGGLEGAPIIAARCHGRRARHSSRRRPSRTQPLVPMTWRGGVPMTWLTGPLDHTHTPRATHTTTVSTQLPHTSLFQALLRHTLPHSSLPGPLQHTQPTTQKEVHTPPAPLTPTSIGPVHTRPCSDAPSALPPARAARCAPLRPRGMCVARRGAQSPHDGWSEPV